MLGERGATETIESRLVSLNFYHDQGDTIRRCENGFYIGNFHELILFKKKRLEN